MTLIKLFNKLQSPLADDNYQFSAIPIPGFQNHRIAKNKDDNPVLLLSTSNQDIRIVIANIKLLNVSVLYDIKCKIQQSGNLIEKTFTVVCFIGKDIFLKEYFLKLCSTIVETLGNTPTREAVRKEIANFIDLFRLVTEPERKTIQGLWAEMLLIVTSKKPIDLVRCWHCVPEEKYDFNNGEERIEVKSSSNGLRIHNFSIEQLNPPLNTKTIIASIFVKQTSRGRSIAELSNDISEQLSGQIELIEKLHHQIAVTLGKSITDSTKLKFDYELAKNSMQFYRVEDIPKISIANVPPLVTDVHFRSDITLIKNISPSEISGPPGLFDSF